MTIRLGVQATLPLRFARQMHRINVSAEKQRKNLERSLAIPLLDNFILVFDFCFNDLSEKSSRLLFLVPGAIAKLENPDFSALSDFIEMNLVKKLTCRNQYGLLNQQISVLLPWQRQ